MFTMINTINNVGGAGLEGRKEISEYEKLQRSSRSNSINARRASSLLREHRRREFGPNPVQFSASLILAKETAISTSAMGRIVRLQPPYRNYRLSAVVVLDAKEDGEFQEAADIEVAI
eukprot:IDg17136t1